MKNNFCSFMTASSPVSIALAALSLCLMLVASSATAVAAQRVSVSLENKSPGSAALLEGIEVRLFAFDGSNKLDEQQVLSNAEGKATFANVTAPAEAKFIVSALFQGVIYVSHGESLPGDGQSLDVLVPVYESTGSSASLSVDSLQIIVTPNDETSGQTVTEMLVLNNSSDKTILGSTDSTITLSLDVPEGIRDVRPLEGFISRHVGTAEGAILYTGPLQPGLTRAVYSYEVPAVASWFFRRRFDHPAKEVSVYTSSFGPAISSRQLLAAEPIEFDGQSFLQYAANPSQLQGGLKFEVKKGELLGDSSGGSEGSVPTGVPFIGAALGGLAILFLLLRPLFTAAPADLVRPGRYVTPTEAKRIALERRKERHLEAVQEIDFDYRTGKLSDDDYGTLRKKYKSQAVKVLAEIEAIDRPTEKVNMADVEEALQAEALAKAAKVFCHQCGLAAKGGDRFCSSCGAALRLDGQAESA